jgi:DNA polymerase-3 subunit epsilon
MFIVLDLETTGLSARDDSIIECAFIKIDRESFQEIDRFTSFVNPGRDIPGLISQITNIFSEDLIDAPKFSDIQDDVQDFIEGLPLIGHNIPFDVRFLESHGIDTSKNPYIDTFFLANFLCSQEKSLNL